MSKNLTRKGLALGALVALGSTVIAGTPATAAPTALYTTSAFGTSTTGVLGQYFTIATSVAGGATNDTVKYFVEGVAAANVSATARFTTDLSATTASSGAYATTTAVETSVDADAKQTSYSTGAAWVAGSYHQLAIKVDSTNVTATTVVKVTPYLDSVVADNKPGANELTGTPITINFVKGSELTATPTITAPVGAKANAIVALSGGVNVEQFRAAANGGFAETPVTVLFKENGADFGTAVNALYNTTDKVFTVDSASNTTAGRIYGATAKINGTDSASAAAVTATAGKAASLSAVAIAKGTSFAAAPAVSTNVVRSGAGSISASTTVTAVSGESAAGQKVTFTVTEYSASSLTSGASVTAGGKTLTNAATGTTEKFTVDVVSDADGVATLPITYAGLVDADKFSVSATAVGATGSVSATAKDLTAQDSVATAIVDVIKETQAGTAVRQIAKGGSFSIAYTVVDQFGQTPTGTFRVVATNSGATNVPSVTSPVAVSAGKVTLSGTDNSTSTDDYTVTATLQKLGTDGVTYANVGSVATTSTISAGTVGTPATLSVTAGATTGVARSLTTLVGGNTVLEQSSVDRTAPANGTTLTTVATDASGALVAGTAVTLTATGVLFKSGTTYGLGSITVYTDASGSTGAVNIYSNLSGKNAVVVTAGAATKSIDITWAAVTSGGSAWTVSAPANILPGQTLKVSAVLKDKYGSVVDTASGDVKVVYTGAGFVTATLPTETDADGAISFTVLLGAADLGTATVKFIYEGANGTLEETTSNDDVVGSASIVLGAAPVAKATAGVSGGTGKFNVAVTNAAGKSVVVKVAGKFVTSFKGTASKKTVAVKASKGSKKVTVYVGGKLVATKTVTVK